MKNLIIILLLFLATVISAQNWTSLKTSNINVSSAEDNDVDIFTNGYGNNIIVRESNALKYYKMDVTGNAGTPINLESSSVISPSISGNASNIYVVYRKSSENYIRTKFSSDGGSNWAYLSNLNYNASSIECVFSNNKLHVTYEVSNVIYYSSYNTLYSTWSSSTTVSTSETGTIPRIASWYTSSQDRVLFLYKNTSTESRWREWNVTNSSWATNPQTAFTVSSGNVSEPKGLAVDGNYIYSYYKYETYNPYNIYSQLQQRSRSNNQLINTSVAQPEYIALKLYSTTTTDNVSHLAFYYNGVLESGYEIGIMRNKHTGSGIEADPVYPYNYGYDQPTMINISSSSNDVYVIWIDNLSNYLRLIYDDQTPLVPPNFAGTTYNDHPKLTWTKKEADIEYFEIYWQVVNDPKNPGAWNLLTTTSNTSFVDYGVELGESVVGVVNYKIRSKDYSNNLSPYTDIVSFSYSGLNKIVTSTDLTEYKLFSNYPNPFNPSTKISYSIKEEGLVTLKVYDVLGKEIATLVNENKSEGLYEAEFDASQLPSGMYIYKIQSGSYSDVKKMLLTK